MRRNSLHKIESKAWNEFSLYAAPLWAKSTLKFLGYVAERHAQRFSKSIFSKRKRARKVLSYVLVPIFHLQFVSFQSIASTKVTRILM